jgi:hypothetical protein
MEVTTKTYKSGLTTGAGPAGVTGMFTANYHKSDTGSYYGVKVLLFVTNCPNRYWARKAVICWLKGKVLTYGYGRSYFDNQTSKTMHETQIIPFTDIAFGVGYKYLK